MPSHQIQQDLREHTGRGSSSDGCKMRSYRFYEATPSPKIVVALGDDACGMGIFKDSYAVIGSVEKVIPVDMKIPGNPPTPKEIIKGLLGLINEIKKSNIIV